VIAETICKILQYPKPSPASDLAVQGFMLLSLALIESQTKVKFSSEESVDNELVKKSIFYVQDHINEPMSVNRLASELFVSRGYLSRIFSNNMHVTLHRFILESKMSKACELLVSSTIPIRDVASACGYNNQFSFSRAFSQQTSVSPTDFRKLYSKPAEIIEC
jgi:AraC family transcriptional regulator of arabinose operon